MLALAACLAGVPVFAQELTEPVLADQTSAAQPSPVPVAPDDAGLPQVDPIITDTEFEAAIPELGTTDDLELKQPLESIEAFERRLAREQGQPGETAEAPPLGDPALADGDPVEEIVDAPIRDAELTKPLPPLDSFEVTPVEFAEAAPDEDAAEVSYRLQIEGLDEADKESSARLRSMFNDLSALRDGDGEAANSAMVQARLTEDGELLKTILASEGWYSATVDTRIDIPAGTGAESLAAVLTVSPGQRYAFGSIEVVAPPTEPPGLIQDNLALKVGEPIVADRVQGAEAQVAVALPQEGYPFTKVGDRSILLDRETGLGDYTLPVEPGPRSRFGGFETDGDLAFGADHIAVLSRFKRGELYDSRKVDDLRKSLVATGLFSTVSVEPQQTGADAGAGDGTEFATIYVKQDAGPPRTIGGTVGYGTGEGFTIDASWTHRNMFPPEGALIARGVAGTKEQGAGVTFRRSNAGRRDRTFEVVAEALRSDYDAYNALTGRLAAHWRYASTPIWQKKFTYAFGAEVLGTAERTWDFDLGRNNRRTYYVAGLNGQVGLDLSNDLLDPTRGFRVTLTAQPEGSLNDGFDIYVKSQLDASGYFPVGDSLVLAGRVRLGTIQGVARENIAPSRRFYAGGGGSVRGFAYHKLGPLAPDGDPVGGRSVNEASAEVRYRFGNFGVVGFLDAGQAYEDALPRFSDIRFGAGIGARYYTNFGPLRFDVATPLGRRPGEGRINIYVSIGQAF
jgi:translocation and assembly module TamA